VPPDRGADDGADGARAGLGAGLERTVPLGRDGTTAGARLGAGTL
jgi:hypothetical protein